MPPLPTSSLNLRHGFGDCNLGDEASSLRRSRVHVSRVFVLFAEVVVGSGRENGEVGQAVGRDPTEAPFLAPRHPRTLAGPTARLWLQGAQRKRKDTWLPEGLGIPGWPGTLFYLKFQKKQTPEYASRTVCRANGGEMTSSHLTMEAGPVGVSHFKFENQLEPV